MLYLEAMKVRPYSHFCTLFIQAEDFHSSSGSLADWLGTTSADLSTWSPCPADDELQLRGSMARLDDVRSELAVREEKLNKACGAADAILANGGCHPSAVAGIRHQRASLTALWAKVI